MKTRGRRGRLLRGLRTTVGNGRAAAWVDSLGLRISPFSTASPLRCISLFSARLRRTAKDFFGGTAWTAEIVLSTSGTDSCPAFRRKRGGASFSLPIAMRTNARRVATRPLAHLARLISLLAVVWHQATAAVARYVPPELRGSSVPAIKHAAREVGVFAAWHRSYPSLQTATDHLADRQVWLFAIAVLAWCIQKGTTGYVSFCV
mmetsp:Transcript_13938/g.39469  ORF Transcript_13938/g.39469 Transcript_13938/m.39469 type:complete len:204 (-) Transcript_13938:42-653(-)